MAHFKNLHVAGRARDLAVAVLRMPELTANDAFRRMVATTAIRIPSLIAQASVTDAQPEFTQAIEKALAKAYSLESLLLVARDLAIIDSRSFATLEARTQEVRKMLVALRASAFRFDQDHAQPMRRRR